MILAHQNVHQRDENQKGIDSKRPVKIMHVISRTKTAFLPIKKKCMEKFCGYTINLWKFCKMPPTCMWIKLSISLCMLRALSKSHKSL